MNCVYRKNFEIKLNIADRHNKNDFGTIKYNFYNKGCKILHQF